MNSIVGFVLERDEIEKNVMRDLNGDGEIDGAKVRVFLFRKNLAAQDLI